MICGDNEECIKIKSLKGNIILFFYKKLFFIFLMWCLGYKNYIVFLNRKD